MATLDALSLPLTRNNSCFHAMPARSEGVKYFRAANPRAKWKIDAPMIIVLSTSKKAAAVRSRGTTSAVVGARFSAWSSATWARAASALASPATVARSWAGVGADRRNRPVELATVTSSHRAAALSTQSSRA